MKAINQAIEPYLFFGGRCEEALEFYTKTLDAKVTALMRYSENPEGVIPPGFEDKVMHSVFHIRGTMLMASDGCGETAGFKGFSLSLSVHDESQAHTIFSALSEGGKVDMPLTKTFYSPCFGMLTDRFGLGWMVIVPGEK